MKASLCMEAAQRPQWPRVYSLDRPRSRGRMPSLVGDSGQVLGVQAGLDINTTNIQLALGMTSFLFANLCATTTVPAHKMVSVTSKNLY